MRLYQLKDTVPYPKIKGKYTVFELETQVDFEEAIIENDGQIFIEDTKAYLITKNKECYVLFYTDSQLKKELYRKIKERMEADIYDSSKCVCNK